MATKGLLSIHEAVRTAAELLERPDTRVEARFHLDSNEVRVVVEEARRILFPEFNGGHEVSMPSAIGEWAERLVHLVATERHQKCAGEERDPNRCTACVAFAEQVVTQTVVALPELRRVLSTDMQAALEADPAAQGPLEVFLCYPGFHAIVSHRIAHIMWSRGARLVARLVSEHAHTLTGIDIHPGAEIDAGFFIDHGTGVVVGETASIGKFVRLYQGVTLGALSLRKDRVKKMHGVKRHPTLEDEVIVYANATILGGDTVVGKGAVIGGNSWITSSIAPGTIVTTQGLGI